MSYEGIEATSENAEKDLDFSYSLVTGAASEKAVGQYYLSKVGTKRFEKGILQYFSTYKHLFQYIAKLKSSLEKKGGVSTDIVTVRKKAGGSLSFKETVEVLHGMGYEEIICQFCRGKKGSDETSKPMFVFAPEKDIKKLSSPVLRMWDSLKKWSSKETWPKRFW